jgi:2-iminobutanoate/2-iminopropanoate deaminase
MREGVTAYSIERYACKLIPSFPYSLVLGFNMRHLISSGSSFEKVAGFSRAVVDGEWIFVSGTTGYDYATMTIAPDLETQTRQAFHNIGRALEQAGASFDDVVRVHYYLVNQADFKKAAPIFGEYLGNARPAATALICGLVEPAMKIEIEVTARRKAD